MLSSSVVNFSLKILISQKRPDNFFFFFFGVQLPQEGTHVLYKYGLAWIILKVIFKSQKGQLWLLFYFEAISQKLFDNLFLYLCTKLSKEGTNELSKYGFDWSTLKVIFQGPKRTKTVKFGSFLLLFANFLKSDLITFLYFLYIASWGWYWSTVKRWISLNYSKGQFQSRKGQVWPIFP